MSIASKLAAANFRLTLATSLRRIRKAGHELRKRELVIERRGRELAACTAMLMAKPLLNRDQTAVARLAAEITAHETEDEYIRGERVKYDQALAGFNLPLPKRLQLVKGKRK